MIHKFGTIGLLLLCHLLLVPRVEAKGIEQKELNFKINSEDLLKGEVHHSFQAMPIRTLIAKYPEFYDLDSLSFIQDKNNELLVGKAAYIIERPVGFFDHEHMTNLDFISHILGNQTVKKINDNTFKVTVPGEDYSYVMRTFFDSDDLSTLPNSRVIRAVAATKKLDVISQSSYSTVVKEMTDFSMFSASGVSVTSYIPLKENKTLIISYSISGVKKGIIKAETAKKDFFLESESVQKLMENYIIDK